MHFKAVNCFIKIGKKKVKSKCLGIKKNFFGEIVFNTSNIGYQEVLTDPSYYNQFIIFTSVNIGNTGFNYNDLESYRVWASGIIVKNFEKFFSNSRSKDSLFNFLKKNKVIILEVEDTRNLVNIIRKNKIRYFFLFFKKKKKLKKRKKKYLANVSTKNTFSFNQSLLKENVFNYSNFFNFKIILIDCGVKFSILRNIVSYNCFVIVTNYKHNKIKEIKPDGIVISNGPGNPCYYIKIVNLIKNILKKRIPILGICFGHQIISLALNLSIKKMKLGHHGINHPVILSKKKFLITSQNHNYSVSNFKKCFFSLFDYTNQGFYYKKKNIICFQGHPESSPGPRESNIIFLKFFRILKNE
ncbi:glutamine-hydrolyzing carbamoyl-phosphate synthase small subunit [Candidatus Vidania fulgoroideorum]